MHQEELRPGTIGIAGAGGAEDARSVGNFVELGVDGVAGATGSVHVPGLVFGVRVTTLDHESRDDTVESDSVIEAFGGELLEILGVSGGVFGEELDDNSTVVGLDDGNIVTVIWGSCSGGSSWFEFAHVILFS